MDLGKKGVFCFTDALNPAQLIELAQRTERLGYSALWYPEVLRYGSFSLGSEKWLCVEQKVLLLTDPAKARELARQAMAFYLPLTDYRTNWQRLGFSAWDLANAGSDRFLDAMVVWGNEAAIR